MAANPIPFSDIELIIFDLDGTLIDSSHDIAVSVNHALAEAGLGARPYEEVKSAIGNGTKVLIRKILHDRVDLFDPVYTAFRLHYAENLLNKTGLYPGVHELLGALEEKHLAVVSNKPQLFVDPILIGLDISQYFFCVIGGETLPKMKPHPDPLLHVMDRAGVAPEKTIMIGDSSIDIVAGKAAGTWTIGLTQGLCPPEEVITAKPHCLAQEISQILPWIKE